MHSFFESISQPYNILKSEALQISTNQWGIASKLKISDTKTAMIISGPPPVFISDSRRKRASCDSKGADITRKPATKSLLLVEPNQRRLHLLRLSHEFVDIKFKSSIKRLSCGVFHTSNCTRAIDKRCLVEISLNGLRSRRKLAPLSRSFLNDADAFDSHEINCY